MRRISTVLSLVVVQTILSGCPVALTGFPDRSVGTKKVLKEFLKTYNDSKIKYKEEIDPATKKMLRDEAVNARIGAIDIHFNTFKQKLVREGVTTGIATDWAVLGLGGVGSIVSHVETAQTLSAISSGITGARTSFDKHAFFRKTMPVLLAEMEALRTGVLAKIRGDLIEGVNDYSLTEAEVDLENYYNAGTIHNAILGLAEEAEETAKEADKDLDLVFKKRERQKRVDQLLDKINNLADDKAFELDKNPPVLDAKIEKIVRARDPTNQRAVNPDVARQMLKMRAVLSKRSDADLDAWEAAVKAAE